MELEQADRWLEKSEVLFELQNEEFKSLNIINQINLKAFSALTNKKYEEAEKLYLTLIKLLQDIQSEEEYSDLIIGIYNHLSVIYTQLNDNEKSEYYSNKSLLENDLKDSESTAVILINASSTDLLNDDYNKALEKLDEALELYGKMTEYNERNFLVALSNQAEAFRGLKNFPKSLELHKEVLTKRIALLGSNHFDVAESYAAIGLLLRDKGELEESNKHLKNALLILKDSSNRNALIIYDSLVKNYYELNDFPNYLNSLKEKLHIEKTLFGPNSVDTLNTLFEIMDADESQLSLMDKIIEIYKKNNLTIDEQGLVKLLNNIKKIIQADKLNESISVLIKIKDHLIINYSIAEAEVLFVLAKCYELKSNFPKAEFQLKRALKIYESLRPSNHVDIGVSHYQLGVVYIGLKDIKRAIKHFKIALPILDKSEATKLYSNEIKQVLRILNI